jgi:hypothetical protein
MSLLFKALAARHGDSLAIHYGDPARPFTIAIDGGPGNGPLLDYLEELRDLEEDEAYPIELLMVSHIDDDHIGGVLHFLEHLDGQKLKKPFPIKRVWHNSFDSLVGKGEVSRLASTAGFAEVASFSAEVETVVADEYSQAILSSVPQGMKVATLSRKHASSINEGRDLLLRDGTTVFELPGGAKLELICPKKEAVEKLRQVWKKAVEALAKKRQKEGKVAAVDLDDSPFNMSSLVFLLSYEGRRILLCGDALCNDVMDGLTELGLMEDGHIHVDLLKIPHHGSPRNNTLEWFQRVTADTYVFSGNGGSGNPDLRTIKRLVEARQGSKYSVYFTYDMPEIRTYLEANLPKDGSVTVVFGSEADNGVTLELA